MCISFDPTLNDFNAELWVRNSFFLAGHLHFQYEFANIQRSILDFFDLANQILVI